MIMKKTINFEDDLCKAIDALAQESERDFSGQVRFMLKDWIKQNVSPTGTN